MEWKTTARIKLNRYNHMIVDNIQKYTLGKRQLLQQIVLGEYAGHEQTPGKLLSNLFLQRST